MVQTQVPPASAIFVCLVAVMASGGVLYGYHLLACMADPICTWREYADPFHWTAGTCVDISSSVAVFGLPDLLASVTEPILWNFMISFATVL
ncbi:hypothetical protein AVEN_249259-1 [Araneus ventricosus]|uniref:Uncharacterized protein n=1 Tax=Araneus ventricosus TaxID=182803 RepID=A0A4Y2KC73_ARAVE|nr:hypothetical protein AVEN_249259-1 [Araneus ventricosus]